MCPTLIEIGSKTAEKNSAQTNRQTNRQTDRQTLYENNGHLAVNQLYSIEDLFEKADARLFGRTERKRLIAFIPFYVIIGPPFVKWFALCYQTVVCLSVCLSCLSLTSAYCGQTVGWIKMKLGMHIGLGPGHDVLDGDPAPPPRKGNTPNF